MNTASRLLCAFAFICGPLLLASPSLKAAPVCLEPGGIGGTGAVATGGIGGTGAPADDEGGIGGTGIVGTITGFGSICVNGVEVHYGSKVALTENGVPASSTRLAIGQVVAVEAGPSRRGLEARSIAILHAYEGPVTEVAAGRTTLRVMGQPVHLAPDARVAAGLRIGEPVRVSGLRNARGEVVASRIDRAPDMAQASAIGAIERAGNLQGLTLSRPLAPSGEVLVRGTWNGRQLDVVQSRPDPGLPFAGRVRNALVEGLVRAQKGDRIEFGGFTAHLDSGTSFAGGKPADVAVGQRIRVSGVFDKGRAIRATRVEFFREQPATSIRQGSGHVDSSGSETELQEQEHENDHEGSGRDETESIERRSDDGETRERIERTVESASGDLERRERIETRESDGRVETRERIEVFENGVRVERIERIERIERPDKADKPERVERVERIERVDKPERIERPEKVEDVERVDRPEDHSGPH
ncbi:DUF5666 domain-containing protein [Pseudomonas sp. GCM10022186]|uniref:DUF5666 domain-containing protein n=1 Tax=Pseudomonas sp. GCM10022186 TaxID=3252650 RepID=UPI00360D6BF6